MEVLFALVPCGFMSFVVILQITVALTVTLLSMFMIAAWIWMLIDVIQRDENTFKSKDERLIWILIIVLSGWVGTLVYYIMEYRKRHG